MSHKKLNISAPSKLTTATKNKSENLGIITNKNTAIVKTYRLRRTDIEKMKNISNNINKESNFGKYKDSDIIRGAIHLLSLQDVETIIDIVQKNK